jgi:4-hydroxybenzoate polyprenyltransferase
MLVSRLLHVAAVAAFAGFGLLVPLGVVFLAGTVLAAALLVWQHSLLRPGDLSRIHTAFFTANGAVAIAMLAAGCIDIYLFGSVS